MLKSLFTLLVFALMLTACAGVKKDNPDAINDALVGFTTCAQRPFARFVEAGIGGRTDISDRVFCRSWNGVQEPSGLYAIGKPVSESNG